MPWTDLLTPFPGGDRRVALIHFRASLKKLDALAEVAINDRSDLGTVWPEIIEEASKLRDKLVTDNEKRALRELNSLLMDRKLLGAVKARDGNICRFCGLTVNWEIQGAGQAGTFIPLDMRMPVHDPEVVFVGCRSCYRLRWSGSKEGKPQVGPNPLPE
ncbi:hypothetical protein [Rothia sp. P4278]|uniref:hypothetical protein n=1 Tax=Rothia sp. P4278 TaxID=3402658 RepID=UPI003AE58CC7